MAKRAPILPEGYNPVGDALRKAVTPQPHVFIEVQKQRVENKVIEFHREEGGVEETPGQETYALSAPTLEEREPIPEIPTDKELKLTSFRFRCTESERKKWHSMAQELTGEHSQLSHFARAAFMLMENSFDELKRVAPDMQRLKYPAKTDAMGLALYEQRLAEFLYDAIKVSGRPRG